MVMRALGPLVVAVVTAMVVAGCDGNGATGPTRGSSSNTTYLDLRSDPGDYIGAGESHRYTLQDTIWNANVEFAVVEPRAVTISMRPIDNSFRWWWDLRLVAPRGNR